MLDICESNCKATNFDQSKRGGLTSLSLRF